MSRPDLQLRVDLGVARGALELCATRMTRAARERKPSLVLLGLVRLDGGVDWTTYRAERDGLGRAQADWRESMHTAPFAVFGYPQADTVVVHVESAVDVEPQAWFALIGEQRGRVTVSPWFMNDSARRFALQGAA